jgi:hypothetical protein
METISKASFGLNESLRIAIPGYYTLALFYLYLAALNGRFLTYGLADSLLTLVFGLGAGFVLNSFNYPNRRAVYKKDQPSEHLRKISQRLSEELKRPEIELKTTEVDREHVRLYFYILNNFFPQTFHEVVMVRGALYYSITYVWLVSGIFGLLGIATLVLEGASKCLTRTAGLHLCDFEVLIDERHVCTVAAYSAFQLMIWFLLTHRNRTDGALTIIFRDQIEWLDLNAPLVRYLIVERTDPRVFGHLKLVPGGTE